MGLNQTLVFSHRLAMNMLASVQPHSQKNISQHVLTLDNFFQYPVLTGMLPLSSPSLIACLYPAPPGSPLLFLLPELLQSLQQLCSQAVPQQCSLSLPLLVLPGSAVWAG